MPAEELPATVRERLRCELEVVAEPCHPRLDRRAGQEKRRGQAEIRVDLSCARQEPRRLREAPRHGVQPTEMRRDTRLAGEIVDRVVAQRCALLDRARNRRRAEVEGRRDVPDARRRRPACALVVNERAFGGFLPLRVLPECATANPTRGHPHPSERSVVPEGLEHRSALLGQLEQSRHVARIGERCDEAFLEPCPQLDPAFAELGSLAQGVARLHRIAGRVQGDAELAEKLETLRVPFREQGRGAPTQPYRGSCVAALPGCDAGSAEMATRVLGDLRCAPVVSRQELGRLLEMEADDLVRGAACLEQIGRRLVQTRAVGPRDGRIRRLVDQRMPETGNALRTQWRAARDRAGRAGRAMQATPARCERRGARRRSRCRTHGRRSRRTRSKRVRPASACRGARSGASAATEATRRLPRSHAQAAAR